MLKYVIPIGSGLIVASVIVSLTNTVGLFIPIATLTAIIVYAIYWMIESLIIELKSVMIGETIPNISWTTTKGELIDLQKFRGIWVLLCYWCPCTKHRIDVLAIKSLYHDKLHKQLQVLIIDAPYKSDITLEEFASKSHLPEEFQLIANKKASIDRTLFNLEGCGPQYFLIDPAGILQGRCGNPFSWSNNSSDDTSGVDEKNALAYLDKFLSDVYCLPSK